VQYTVGGTPKKVGGNGAGVRGEESSDSEVDAVFQRRPLVVA
jgi:hypothetical protein